MSGIYCITPEGVQLGLFIDTTPDVPYLVIEDTPEYFDQVWLFPGWSESQSRLREIELEWQSVEMPFIANQLLAIEEEAEDALPGTRKQWLNYRTDVRLWHESPNFPDKTKRPVRPE